MAEQNEHEMKTIVCTGGGPIDGGKFTAPIPSVGIDVYDTSNVRHLYTYNPTTNTYQYKGVRK